MRKILLLFIVIAMVAALPASSCYADEKREDLIETLVKIATRPAEEIIGRVVDLERIVVSPSKVPESALASASSVSTITEEDMGENKILFLKDFLPHYASISKSSSGAFGGPTTIRIRGANPNHTFLVMDNVKIYDPTSPDGAFNFAHLPLDNMEQVEITRGPQGALYGSDAIGGLISIATKKPYKAFCEAFIEAGSYYTMTEYVNLGGYEKGLHYSFSYSQLDTGGMSNADKATVPSIQENDPYHRKCFSGRLDYEVADGLTVGATIRNIYASFKYDDTNFLTGAMQDNDQLFGKWNLFMYSIYVEHQPIEQYDYAVRYSYLNNFRRDYDYLAGMNDWYRGRVCRFDFQNNIRILDFDTFTAGYDYYEELSDSYYYDYANGANDMPKVFARNSALYLQNKIHYKDIIGSTQNMRVDHHSMFGTNNTYKVDGFYLAPTGTKLRAVFATSFKAPSLYQLDAPANPAWLFLGGNPNLDPEKSNSYEMGIDQYLFEKALKLSITYFQIRFYNLIKYYTDPATWNSTYRNAQKAKSLGMEYSADLNLFDGRLMVAASCTSTSTKDYSTDRPIARVPFNQFNINVNVKPVPQLNINTNISHMGPRFDVGTDKIKAYTLVDLTAEYEIMKGISIYTRLENLLNKHYQEVRGYGMPALSAYGGIKGKF